MNDFPPRVTLFDDGVYRWSYDMDMWHNRFLLKLLLKAVGIICAIPILILLLLSGPERVTPTVAAVVLLSLAGVYALTLGIYALCALAMHGVYRLHFAMDESAIVLVQSAATKRRNSALAVVATVAGVAAGKPNEAFRVGTALGCANAVGTTSFSIVTRIMPHPECDVIDMREWFGMNQIYVNAEDYAFVRDFILSHIPEKAQRRSGV